MLVATHLKRVFSPLFLSGWTTQWRNLHTLSSKSSPLHGTDLMTGSLKCELTIQYSTMALQYFGLISFLWLDLIPHLREVAAFPAEFVRSDNKVTFNKPQLTTQIVKKSAQVLNYWTKERTHSKLSISYFPQLWPSVGRIDDSYGDKNLVSWSFIQNRKSKPVLVDYP